MLPKPYYEEDGITIYHADCMDILPHLPKVDLVITSPPYGVDANNCSYGGSKYLSPDIINLELLQCVSNANADYIWINIQPLAANKRIIFEWFGLNASRIKDVGIWKKQAAPPQQEPGVMNSGFEFLVCLTDIDADKRKFKNCSWRGNVNNVFNFPSASSSNVASKIHHATFPIELPSTLISTFGGDTILDPFLGSGTTAVAAKNLGRKCIGIEKEEKYCEIAVNRLRQQVMKF